jgi:hypothetical protein
MVAADVRHEAEVVEFDEMQPAVAVPLAEPTILDRIGEGFAFRGEGREETTANSR